MVGHEAKAVKTVVKLVAVELHIVADHSGGRGVGEWSTGFGDENQVNIRVRRIVEIVEPDGTAGTVRR